MGDSTLKILRVIPSMNPQGGGPAQGIRYSIPPLEALGLENEVVSLDNPSATYLSKDHFTIHALGGGHGPLHYHPRLVPWLQQHISQYDTVIIHGLWSFHSYAVTKVIRRLREQDKEVPKVYVMPHGMLDPWFQRDKSRRLKAFRNKLYWRLIEKKTVNQADGLLFTCQQELLLAKKTFKQYLPKQEINVGYGIATPPVCYQGMSTPTEKPYWLFLSRIHPKKGVDLLLKAYIRLQREQKNIPHLVIGGPGIDNAYGQGLLKLAKGNTQIHFTGMLQGDKKWGALYGCEAFILPSHQENFGIAVAEALACGKPVLISDQVNIWREIQKAGAGIIGHDTEDGIYNMIESWYYSSPEEKAKIIAAAYQAYQQYFTVTEAARNLKNILAKQ